MTADGPLSTAHLPRPDPTRGVFETLLVVDGRPIELDAHLERLAASVRELFGTPTMARVAGAARVLAENQAREQALARLRLTLAPDGDGKLDLSVVVADVDRDALFPTTGRGPVLAPVTVAGGLGGHKWADRRLLDDIATQVGGALPLILDVDGAVLEAERANVFVVRHDALTTPAADGRILPGIARAHTIEIARRLRIELHERHTTQYDLLMADAVFLTGSVRGIEPVRLSPPGDAIVDRIAAALRQRWLGSR